MPEPIDEKELLRDSEQLFFAIKESGSRITGRRFHIRKLSAEKAGQPLMVK